MKKIIALTCFMLAIVCVRADLILQETFNYTNGPVSVTSTNGTGSTTISNWLTHSGNIDSFVNNRRLEVSSTSAYLGVSATRSGDVHRVLTTTPNSIYTNSHQVLYASFVANFTNLPTGSGAYFAHFYVNGTTFPCRVWALTNGTVLPNTFRIGIQMGSASTPNQIFPVDLALNTDYQLVIGYDPAGLDAATIWINPINSTDTSLTTSDAYAPAANIVNSFSFRQASGFGGFLTVSNLCVATTFDEAATNVLATNAVAPKIVYQPVASIFNFPSAVFVLSAVANGQGLGSMAYQWQVASSTNAQGRLVSPANLVDGGDITGSSTNILSFSSAVTGDSGFYALIATTPFGLSVTSSVAAVSIVDGPYPPTINVQPVNTSSYQGYPVSLNVSVASPPSGGTVSFTWYSNNVVVSSSASPNGAQTDSGLSSSYGFASGLTNYSATYKVAATNSNPGGVVSSSAVLSVIIPPSVSIAFLRQLVDPANNYQATNSKIAYQATGIITTYTNITTGNTASYYLQDGTAGINIFATFGSTFRPAQGDVVTFVGVMSSFSSGLELFADPVAGNPSSSVPYTSYTVISNNFVLPIPRIIPFTITNSANGGYANMNNNIAGRLVELTGVFFGTNSGNFVTNGFVTVTNSLGQPFNLWVSAQAQDVIGQTWPNFAYSVSGVMFGGMNPNVPLNGTANPNFAVAVTKFADINTNVGVTGSATICVGSSVTLSVQTNGGYNASFLWSPGGATTPSITVTPGSTTTYTVTVTDMGSATVVGSAFGTVTVNPLPVTQAIKATSASICSNTPTIISLAGSVTGTTYLLQTNANLGTGSVFGITNGTGSAVAFTNVFPKVSITYYVLATNSTGCGLLLGSTNIVVNALPVLGISPASPSICSNSPVLLTASGATTYGWSPATGLSAVSGASVTANPTTTTTYTVTGTNASGCTSTTTVTVTVNPLPVLAISPASPSICSNSPVLLTASGATTYGWSPATGLSAVSGTSVTATPLVTTTYTVTGTNASGCTSTKQVTVTVNPLPVLAITPASTNIINGNSALLTASGATTYGWSPATGLSGVSGASVTASPTTTTTYTVTGTNASGCTSTKQITVTVVTLQPVTITGISGSSITYTGGAGSRFVLLASDDLTTLTSVWTRFLTNSSTPGTFTIPAVGSTNQLFYRIKSE